MPYTFYVNNEEVVGRLPATGLSVEKTVDIVYAPQAVFRVRPVTRSTATLTGHTNSVVAVQFSPDGTMLASGSGDATVRLWDLATQTPLRTLTGHRDWVLCLAWSPDGRHLASGSRDGQVRVWTVATGDCTLLGGHRDFVTSLAWEPYAALAGSGRRCGARLASASKDGSVRVWDVAGRTCVVALSGHSQAVQALRWAGSGYIYTGSRDRTVNVYDGTTGRLVRTLRGHGHWVNSMSVSTDFVTRTGPFDHTFKDPKDEADGLLFFPFPFHFSLSWEREGEFLYVFMCSYVCCPMWCVGTQQPLKRQKSGTTSLWKRRCRTARSTASGS